MNTTWLLPFAPVLFFLVFCAVWLRLGRGGEPSRAQALAPVPVPAAAAAGRVGDADWAEFLTAHGLGGGNRHG